MRLGRPWSLQQLGQSLATNALRAPAVKSRAARVQRAHTRGHARSNMSRTQTCPCMQLQTPLDAAAAAGWCMGWCPCAVELRLPRRPLPGCSRACPRSARHGSAQGPSQVSRKLPAPGWQGVLVGANAPRDRATASAASAPTLGDQRRQRDRPPPGLAEVLPSGPACRPLAPQATRDLGGVPQAGAT